MFCPYCKNELFFESANEVGDIEKRWYHCKTCHRNFERHVIRNNMGLIKNDTLYETEEGSYKNFW